MGAIQQAQTLLYGETCKEMQCYAGLGLTTATCSFLGLN